MAPLHSARLLENRVDEAGGNVEVNTPMAIRSVMRSSSEALT